MSYTAVFTCRSINTYIYYVILYKSNSFVVCSPYGCSLCFLFTSYTNSIDRTNYILYTKFYIVRLLHNIYRYQTAIESYRRSRTCWCKREERHKRNRHNTTTTTAYDDCTTYFIGLETKLTRYNVKKKKTENAFEIITVGALPHGYCATLDGAHHSRYHHPLLTKKSSYRFKRLFCLVSM